MALNYEVLFLVDDKRPARVRRWVYEQLADAAARLDAMGLGRLISVLERLPGSRTRRSTIDGLSHHITPVPENAFPMLAAEWRTDVVVGNSIQRLAWRKIRQHCRRHGIGTVLYVREVSALGHLDATGDIADALVANTGSLCRSVEATGHHCELIPSMVDLSVTRTNTSRTQILLVNPIESHGIDLFWRIADRLPHMQFRIQESWPLDRVQLAEIRSRLASASNVEFARRAPPGPHLYATARLLLVPHQLDNRPRVILEAQSNGIPVLVSNFPGLIEACGPGGVIVPADDPAAWVAAINKLADDSAEYERLRLASLSYSQRLEIQPSTILERFEATLRSAVDRALTK